MKNWIRKAVIVLRALPTQLALIALVLQVLIDEVGTQLPNGVAIDVVRMLAKVVVTIITAIVVLRRVTPVIEQLVGIEPPAGVEVEVRAVRRE